MLPRDKTVIFSDNYPPILADRLGYQNMRVLKARSEFGPTSIPKASLRPTTKPLTLLGDGTFTKPEKSKPLSEEAEQGRYIDPETQA